MAIKRETVTFTALNREIKSGKFRNIYVLQGEEPYYIDRLQQLIIDTVLTEDQRDFNLCRCARGATDSQAAWPQR